MVTRSSPRCQADRANRGDWQHQIATAVRSAKELCQLLDLDPALAAAATPGARRFAVRVPLSFVNRIERGNPDDPLLLQILPQINELLTPAGYSSDPVGDLTARAAPALLRKYNGRVLLLTTAACALHCRYCLRRCFPAHAGVATAAKLSQALALIAAAPSVDEVILSGGDPLMLADRLLARLLHQLTALPQLKRLRLHTRVPVALPARVTPALVQLLSHQRLPVVMVIHANHAAELNDEVARALNQLRRAGVVLFNQSVLLHGVNDDVATLRQLSERLFDCGVLPYYLHLLDLVTGSAAFYLPDQHARRLMIELRRQLPGYLMPRPVREVAGALSKLPFV
ncbi:EF-P beta-lysylation protein EpmB [Rhodoferax sp. 4810]|uniref:L-lysine 2,3-aminomutase n=1 Tax=Thiospirillum jenense TaxID=1653858 RepID=A0A839HBT4_9GAMM|nr:EF-P beta-lysylation protein EpmB [Thiospirillum jenense]MBB1076536.1 EF-P beta-lysylation protein EpmB [Rhodoferax jenense]MBB1124758.1 EF-P beta-lysylation protein EpmB [Thiospirillum jenense]